MPVQQKPRAFASPTLVDRIVGWVSPESGVRRLKARTLLSAMGGYVGGRRDRRGTRNWRPTPYSADEDTLDDLPDLRSRSRDLLRNTPLAAGAVNTVCTSVIGSGLCLQSAVDRDFLNLTDEQADAWEAAAQREFALFEKTADHSGHNTFKQLQELAFRTQLASGDCFAVRRFAERKGDTYGIKVQLIEADRCSNPHFRQDGDGIVDGVELTSTGFPMAYHFSTRPVGRTGLKTNTEWSRVPARSPSGMPRVIHLMNRVRPEQTRGVPYLAPVIELIKTLGDYTDAEARAATVAAMFTVFVESDAIGDDDDTLVGSITGAVDSATEVEMGSGAIIDLAPGEKVTTADPNRPNSAFDKFVQATARQIGVALELPFEVLTKSFTASFSASRAALEMAWQFFLGRQTWLATSFCQPVYEWVITEAVARGRLNAPGFFTDPLIRQAYLGARWIGPARMSIDPVKEATADDMYLNMGAKTLEQISIERTGIPWENNHRQRVKEVTKRREDGIQFLHPLDSSADLNAANTLGPVVSGGGVDTGGDDDVGDAEDGS